MYIIHTNSPSNSIKNLAHLLHAKLKQITIKSFSNQEFFTNISFWNEKILIEFPKNNSINDSIIQLALILNSLSKYEISKLALLIPYMPYSRQDKINHTGDSLGIKVFADILNNFNLDKIITFDLHSESCKKFFKAELINLTQDIIFSELLKQYDPKNTIVISMDEGGLQRSKLVSEFIKCDFIVPKKQRFLNSLTHSLDNIPDKPNLIIVDDIIDSGKSLESLLKILSKFKFDSIDIYVTHIVRPTPELEFNLKNALSDIRIKKIYSISETKNFLEKHLINVDCSKILSNYLGSIFNNI